VTVETFAVYALDGFPDVQPGDDLGRLVVACLQAARFPPLPGDVLVIAHKVVSKAEGAVVDLAEVVPSPAAAVLAAQTDKDPRLCELILRESRRVVRCRRGLIIAEHRLGLVCANAGIDHSNAGGGERVVLLPADPDASARNIRDAVARAFGVLVGVIVNDSQGRAWREGAVGVCIGCCGIAPLRSHIGRTDRDGYVLRTSVEGVADELAAAATLLQGQSAEGTPLVLIRGAGVAAGEEGAERLVRRPERDLFR
jgi:coenzyme F420-0:L-glutamate ligase/coenzyme F420-1:gamma-L-glutamate ligase